jgi:hypothetical protein
MSYLCIQIQPDLAPGLSIDSVLSVAQKIAADKTLVDGIELCTGNDNGPYIDLLFNAVNRRSLWERLKRELYEGKSAGPLAQASIVTCEGERGWADYLLLFHFDPSIERDEIEEL